MSESPPGPPERPLSDILPIFPLAGVLLLPRAQLPLNIFEPRYLAMTGDAMAGDQFIGMVQPRDPAREDGATPAVYDTGCAGCITEFEETDDGRYLITLTGLCRFSIVDELPLAAGGYRRVHAAYDAYADDLNEPDEGAIDRDRLWDALRACFPDGGEQTFDWRTIGRTSGDGLVSALAMSLPFAPSEKQALLEAPDLAERSRVLRTLMEMLAANERCENTEARMQ